MTEYSGAAAFLGTVKPGTGTATSANNVGVFAEVADRDTPATIRRIASKGEAAPGVNGGVFAVLKDPVIGYFSTAFPATMKTVPGLITAADNDGIWLSDDEHGLQLIAREGAEPPEVPEGATWKAFTSLAQPSSHPSAGRC